MNETRLVATLFALVFAGLVFGAMLKHNPVMSVNDGSRWDTVWALLEGRGYVIDFDAEDGDDEYPYGTIDKVKRDGKFYSSKPALMPTLLAGVVWTINKATGLSIPDNDKIVVRAIIVLINIIPFCLVIILYAGLLERLGISRTVIYFCTAVVAFGTYLTGWAQTLNNHTLAACAVFFALYCVLKIKLENDHHWKNYFLAGLFSAWAFANEMPAALFTIFVFVWLVKDNPKKTFAYALLPALLVVAAFFYTTYLSTGTLVPYYLKFNTELYQYEGSYWANPHGIDAANEPKWLYLFNMTFGHRGIFTMTPIFLIAFYGMLLREKYGLSVIRWAGLALTAVVTGVYVVRTNNYGGGAQGMRWLFWLIPFWLISLAPAAEKHFESRAFRTLCYLLFVLGLVSVGYTLNASPWGNSWLHNIVKDAGWIDY